ncbi:glycoside hydrolase family 3 N-terminal domain-containing protein [Demequina capsici]|uniref:Glycoside hydrolase family 3 N-terminal domain-containing protein n=1 Tax=Demequina capsici TaxID=3075620 RepID=A0AA96FC23_9MICO|nr:glycoside hydrolase family 3 N-terminal domain-containing protein [Demequina sp. PMTSA13]WNM28071.1 glycoside hydrolase family 3 N-terminal domain-containing protein [Demequina sp. PMTSA13]
MSNRKYLGIWIPIIAFFTILLVVANVAINIYSKWVETVLGAGTYTVEQASGTESWDTDYNQASYDSLDAEQADAYDLVEEIESEGIVLAKNDNGALPLSSGAAVTMLGRDSADPVYGGAGSGSVDTSTAVDIKTGLENAGFSVNPTAYSMFADYAANNGKADIVMDDPASSSYVIGEMPVDQYTTDAVDSFSSYNDAAIVVIGRGGGEGGDLTQDMTDVPGTADPRAQAGEHQLELNQDEKAMLAEAEANFDKVIVVVNASTSMEMGIVQDDPNVDAVLLVGSPGQTGFNALGDVLDGTVNPSGRTTDTWAADFTQDPTWNNFGNYEYSNVSTDNGSGYFVQYEEGIYVGYRYYETAAAENYINYDDAVVYPFGYGLSYTNFQWDLVSEDMGDTNGDITLDVQVTNTGDVAGKDVVEVYYNAPYTPGGIEKAEVVLGDYAKTDVLQPGESQTVTLTFAVQDMASYDYEGAGAYVLEAGDYGIRVQTDSHNLADGIDPLTYTVNDTITYGEDNPRSSDAVAATNEFDDVSALFSDTPTEGLATNLSRADFAGTWPTSPTDADKVASDAIVADFQAYDATAAAEASDAEMPTTGANNGLQLIDLRGKSYDDPVWDLLLDQLTVDDITNVILNGAYNTAAIESIVKPATVDLDGPAGFSSFLNDDYNGTAYPSEYVIAQTWNKDLAYKMGQQIGEEALQMGANGWYAPALNIHRSPFAGRNFEYYSEDPYLTGAMATQVSDGALSKGVYTFLKHFAMNDQETNRTNNGVSSQANEQAIREIYLKAFEIPVKDVSGEINYISDDQGTISTATVGQMAMMSSFNRIGGTWAGGSKALMTNVLRDEWGFQGFVITDFNLYGYMYPDQGIDAGTDHMLTFAPMKELADTTSALAVTNLRKTMHDMLYTVVNSNAMDGIAPASTITYTPPAWRYWQLAISIAIGLLLAAAIVMVTVRVRKHGKGEAPEPEGTEPSTDEPQGSEGVDAPAEDEVPAKS